ncbi:variable surface protein Vir16, putative [Plasmodium vivax]|uniref:Variable surface protein Vir16, putative n=1 Tax=Plasmodium vivax (strain Salvador I) TaxID=126793 RepID=A5KD87_PLAVS|nr:variable surface protein Vir16, putative [Plasmodium vivax]EDL42682.1 variable surface protein Vir16, putative [Plasmodium vivax]|eukprot:XP_001612475.1 variable surface protein Vir16 [Plasmodium vivax Sal-1]
MVTHSDKSGFNIKELPSERFYEWLNNNLIYIWRYSSDCNSLNNIYKRKPKNKELCAKIVNYIKSKPKISTEEHLKDHHCNLFNYWIYEQLANDYDNNSTEPALIFADILFVFSGLQYYPNNKTCKLDDNIVINPDRKKRKELYEYCIDYKTILEKSKLSKDNCKKYHTHVKDKIELYKKYQTFCSSDDNSECPDFFHKFCENKDPKNLLDQLNCDDIWGKEKPPHGDASGTTSNFFLSSQSASNLSNAFLGVVVTSMTSGFLYKFTPLGTRIRNGLLWNNNNISNLNTNVDELFVQESYSPYSGEEQHHIGYHAS